MSESITQPKKSKSKGWLTSGRTVLLAITTLLLASVYAHIEINGSQDSEGLLAFLDHIYDIALALGISVLVLLIGRTIGRVFRLEFASTAEDLSFSLFLGTGVTGLSILFLGLLGLLQPLPVTILIAFYILLVTPDLTRFRRDIINALRPAKRGRGAQLLASLFLCFLAILVLRTASPLHIGDEAIYHLPVTKQFVQQGRVFASIDNSLGNLPFLIHMIYALFLMAGSDIAPKLFSLFLAVGTALALYAFCARFLTRRVGVVAMFGFFGAGMIVEVAVTTRIDVSLAGMLFLSTYAMINYLETNRVGWLWLSGMLAGFSLGIKHSAGVWLAFVAGMFLVEQLIAQRKHYGAIIKSGLLYACIVIVTASPWYVKNYVWFQNPVYPLFTGEVADIGPSGIRYFNADDERKLDDHFEIARKKIPATVKGQEDELMKAINRRPPRHPTRLWEFFTRPNSYLMEEAFHYPNYMFIGVPFLFFLKRKKWLSWLLTLSVLFALSVTQISWMARMLLPVYPALTIIAAYTLVSLGDKLKRRISLAPILPISAVAVSMTIVLAVSLFWIYHTGSLAFVTGGVSRHEFLVRLPYYRPFEFINSKLPSSARVMMFGVQANYDIERDYLTDETWFATKWRRLLVKNSSLEDVNQDLKHQGVTHIFYSSGLFSYAAMTGVEGSGGMPLIAGSTEKRTEESRRLGPEYQLLRNWSTFTLYRSQFLQPIYSDQNFQIFKIR